MLQPIHPFIDVFESHHLFIVAVIVQIQWDRGNQMDNLLLVFDWVDGVKPPVLDDEGELRKQVFGLFFQVVVGERFTHDGDQHI